jgi:hypothetical protein
MVGVNAISARGYFYPGRIEALRLLVDKVEKGEWTPTAREWVGLGQMSVCPGRVFTAVRDAVGWVENCRMGWEERLLTPHSESKSVQVDWTRTPRSRVLAG